MQGSDKLSNRFEHTYDEMGTFRIIDTKNGKQYTITTQYGDESDDVLNLINSLSEENEKLKEKVVQYDDDRIDMFFKEQDCSNLLNKLQETISNHMKLIDLLMPKKCVDDLHHCKYFCWHRNYNYETNTNDTITLWCELLDNKDTYDRDTGDKIWENGFDDCPLKKYI